MVDLEKLKQDFVEKLCPPWGQCLVIPGSDFKQSWEQDLYDKGISCVHTDFGDPSRPVVLVRLDPDAEEDTSTTSEPSRPEIKEAYKRGRWSKEDQKKLLRVMGEECTLPPDSSVEEKAKVALEQFPGRSLHSLLRQYWKPAGLEEPVPSRQEVRESTKEEPLLLMETTEPRTSQEQTAEKPPGLYPYSKRYLRDVKKKKRIHKKEKSQQPREPQEPFGAAKLNLACNVAIHIEAKSAASIKAVITLLKELK